MPTMQATKDILGHRIYQRRIAKRWRQQDLAEAIGDHQQNISRWEAGDFAPDLATIEKLATVLGVSPAWLVGWSNS